MNVKKTAFALYFGTRSGFPGDLVARAREEMSGVLKKLGHEVLMLAEDATGYGAVETRLEGEKYASFLRNNRGLFGGVIICLPNFGDENGAVTALREAEVLDLSDIFCRMKKLRSNSSAYKSKTAALNAYADFRYTPEKAFDNLVRLGVVIDAVVDEFAMDAIALRCWLELQEQLGISACVLLGEMNSRGVTAACEVDVGNAVAMHALSLAAGQPPTCLDWNNNYADDDNKCILFHCGPVPKQLMTGPGRVTHHSIISTSRGETCGYGCHQGRIAPFDFTFGSMLTEAGKLKFYLGEGRFTDDPIPDDFFGCAGVAQIDNLQDVLLHVGLKGFRHHVSLTPGRYMAPVREALERYRGFDVAIPQSK